MAEEPRHDDGTPLPEIAGYRLLRVINHGGMSTVYLARQHSLGRDVAIKVMSTQALTDETSRRRFENEVRTIARLEHPHVVRIHEVGRTLDGLPYYAMPYMARGHLGQRDYSKSERRVVEIANLLLSVIGYAHSRNIVHRDVKAENVLFDDADRPLLADFGIALRKDWGGARMTGTGMAVGSTAYMAPEQARGEVVDGRADLYALGVLIWEMLTGKLPFEAPDALSMAVMHAQDPVPKLPAHLAHWQHFMNRALAKQPAQRFQDAAQMRAGIESVTERSLMPALRDRLQRLPPLRQYAKPIWAVCALLAFIGVGVLGAEYLSRRRGAELPAEAADAAAVAAHNEVTSAMLKPLQDSPARKAIETARQRIAAGQLTSPLDANAHTSVLEAWNADATNVEVLAVVAELTNAFADTIAAQIGSGNDARAREIHAMAAALALQTGTTNSPAYRGLRARTEAAVKARFEAAARRYDRDAAERTVQLVADFDLPPQLAATFTSRAARLPHMGAVLPDGGVLRASTGGAVAVNRQAVTRTDYARFVAATKRTSSLCRERASLLRVIAPRDWRTPGFSQAESEPVVCISLQDAEAYAAWHSRETGQHWRLPTAREASETPAQAGNRAVALWSRDCATTCTRRVASGKSWRSQTATRPLLANRGYDDVGFRLVRDLQ
ncbi:bifunctional serine/threonine-protein kinase/formylglycine-generating enzyme family protein [Lysobacter solisilvae (ex Woo and Kim 2020)]|uniref:Protein kinase n=1 Tax=Agrilutibacter terrestris TaxID=2865112 RepID=A0A7H0FW02_9GAMM|nr:bifunctional serine/threonine-protein kinase/formylglycine-generating enzyme family protein [Lysobacter terrestris]QNP40218.1 protein kinase [Lysobacter terrestris]